MKTYKIHLIRHGLSEGMSEGRYIGHTDEPLSEEGRRQLEELSKKLEYPQAQVVITSPLKRCIQTAEILYPFHKATELPGFIECDFGEFEGLTAEELSPYPEFAEWLKGDKAVAPPNGESSEAFGQRICSTFVQVVEGMMKSGTFDIAIITHGGVIASLLSAFDTSERPIHEWMTPCGCGYTMSITPSVWSWIQRGEVIWEIPYSDSEDEDSSFNDDEYSDEFDDDYGDYDDGEGEQ